MGPERRGLEPAGLRARPARHDVDRVYGFGYSQTGSMLITYINAIRPRVVAADGRPIYDGYFVAVAGGGVHRRGAA